MIHVRRAAEYGSPAFETARHPARAECTPDTGCNGAPLGPKTPA
jgi:hypothetical protein